MKRTIKFVNCLVPVLVITLVLWTNLSSAQGQSFGPRYTEWSAPEPIPILNSPGVNEVAPNITHDGLRLYFNKGPMAYISHRTDRNADWEAPVALPATINAPSTSNGTAFETIDGHWLFFNSNRPGGLGLFDIWVSWRRDKHDDNGWQAPVDLTAVNSVGFEGGPMIFEDETTGTVQLYLAAAPYPGGTQAVADIYVSTLGPNGFHTPVPVAELNEACCHDGKPFVRRDGLEIFFESHRFGPPPWNPPGYIMVSTRWSTDLPWSAPEVAIYTNPVGTPGDRWITTPSLSHDSMTLYIAVNEPGTDLGDIYVSYRQKVKGNN